MTQTPRKRGRPQGSTRYAEKDNEAIALIDKALKSSKNLSLAEAIRRVVQEMGFENPNSAEERLRAKYRRRLAQLEREQATKITPAKESGEAARTHGPPRVPEWLRERLLQNLEYLRSPEFERTRAHLKGLNDSGALREIAARARGKPK